MRGSAVASDRSRRSHLPWRRAAQPFKTAGGIAGFALACALLAFAGSTRGVPSSLAIQAASSLAIQAASPAIQADASPPSLVLLSKNNRRSLQLSLVGDQEFVALDELATALQLAVREEALGAISVSYKSKTIVLTADQALASVAGKLISLPSAPSRTGRRWLVPVEFINRALAPIYDARLDLHKSSRLVVIGDLRVPRVAVRYDTVGPSLGRLTIDVTPRAAPLEWGGNPRPSMEDRGGNPRPGIEVSQERDRLLVKFDADAIDAALPPGGVPGLAHGQGLIQTLRIIDPASLAIELGPRFSTFKASIQPAASSSRLVIDLAGTTAEAGPAAGSTAAPGTTPPAPGSGGTGGVLPPLQQPDSGGSMRLASIRTVAIDPGHGGQDQGVVGPGGTREKDLTLAVARRVKAAVEGRLGIRVVLTREDDRDVPLDDRAAVANNNKADLFISLHASASRRPVAAGATIFCAGRHEASAGMPATTQSSVSGGGSEREGAAVNAPAATGTGIWSAPVAAPLATFSAGTRDIELVVWDLAQRRHLDTSIELAKTLEQAFRNHVPLSPHAVDYAPLRILESANMPAVLLEIGYLSNADLEKQLTGTEFQSSLVQAILDAVVRFRDTLDARRPNAAVSERRSGGSS